MRNIENVSRRGFLKGVVGTSAFVLAVRYVPPIFAGEAAPLWNVPAAECSTEPHLVVHAKSGRKLGYGELASAAAKLGVPMKAQLTLKKPAEWRYIGKGKTSYDLEKLCTGKAIYGMDAKIDGMIYASVEHPPVDGGKVKSYD